MQASKRVVTLFVFALIILGQLAVDIYLPSFPAIRIDLNTTRSAVKLTLTFFLLGYSLSQLIYGPLSEKWGRRKILLIGLAIFVVGCIGSIIAGNINFLLISRLIQGLGVGAANVLARAILRDVFEGKELSRRFSYMGLAWVTVPIIAPLIGGYIQHYVGWRMNFIVLACLVSIVWIWILLKLPETKNVKETHSIHPRTIIKNYLTILTDRMSMGYITSAFFLYGIFVALYTAGPFLLQLILGLSPVSFGWMMVVASLGFLLGSLLNASFIHRYKAETVIWIGLIFSFIISLIMFLIAIKGTFNVAAIIAPMFFLFLFIALIYPNCISGSLASFPKLAGTSSALFGCVVFLGGVVTSAVLTFFREDDQIPFATIVFLQATVALLILWLSVLRKKAPQR